MGTYTASAVGEVHVVAEMKDEDVKEEMKDKKEDVKEELNEEFARFKKLAGLIK